MTAKVLKNIYTLFLTIKYKYQRERQQQLEELNKELMKAQDEVASLRSHMKGIQKNGKVVKDTG